MTTPWNLTYTGQPVHGKYVTHATPEDEPPEEPEVTRKPWSRLTDADVAAIVEMRESGETLGAIASKLSIALRTVQHYCDKAKRKGTK